MSQSRLLKLILQYDGAHFSGWQIQPGKRTVQGELTRILKQVTRGPVTLLGASRTDAGVHALGQVAHFKTDSSISCYRLLGALNGLLPSDVAVLDVRECPQGFHARESARRKTYRYLILNSPIRVPLWEGRAWHVRKPLNLKAMRKGARCLVGRHDFKAFQGRRPATKTTVRKIYTITIRRGGPVRPEEVHGGWPPWGNHIGLPLQITITGNGFLKQMVRNIVGLLVEIGEGRHPVTDMARALSSRDRTQAGVCAPPHGLYLVSVKY